MSTDLIWLAASMPHDDAVAELHRCSGTQFDPDVIAAFTRVLAPAPAAPCASRGNTRFTRRGGPLR